MTCALAPETKMLKSKGSKAPLYADALRIYLAETAPSLPEIAERVGLNATSLIACAESQNWPGKRALILRDQSATRPIAAQAVDSKLVAATVHHVETFTDGWREVAERVVALPVEPDAAINREADAQAWNKEHTRLLARKVDLMRQVSQGVREMTEAAMVLGLAKAPTPDKADAKGLDLSKLTQLNVTITNALAETPKLAEAIELPASEPSAAGGF